MTIERTEDAWLASPLWRVLCDISLRAKQTYHAAKRAGIDTSDESHIGRTYAWAVNHTADAKASWLAGDDAAAAGSVARAGMVVGLMMRDDEHTARKIGKKKQRTLQDAKHAKANRASEYCIAFWRASKRSKNAVAHQLAKEKIEGKFWSESTIRDNWLQGVEK